MIRKSYPSKQPEVVNAKAAAIRAKLGDLYAARLQHYRLNARLKIVEMFGGKCVGCGERNPLVLTLNHVDGYEGTNPKAGSRGGWPLYMKILAGKESAESYDLRCFNCQIMYEFQRGRIFSKIRGETERAIEKAATRNQVDFGRDPISIS